jgi:branched-chain amino acid transport system substrate-binding protein
MSSMRRQPATRWTGRSGLMASPAGREVSAGRVGRRSAIALALAVIPAAASLAAAADPGFTADAVVLGSHQTLSGPAASFSSIPRASEAYFAFVNAQGGVHGRKIVYRYDDDGFEPARALGIVRKLVERERVFAIFNGLGPGHLAVYRYLLDKGVPDMYVANPLKRFAHPPDNAGKPYRTLFTFVPTFATEGAVMAEYAVRVFPGKKTAMLYGPHEEIREAVDAFKRVVQGRLPIVAEDTVDQMAVSLDSQLLRARDRKAEVVFLWHLPKFVAMYLRKAHELGWAPMFLVTATAQSPTTWKLAGPDCEVLQRRTRCGASDGVISLKWLPGFDEVDDRKVARHYQLMEQYAGGLRVDNYTLYGQAGAELMVETLRRAGPALTREALVKAAESITGWSDGLLTNVTMGPDDHAPVEDLKVVEIRGGRIARELTGWMTGTRRALP